MVPLCMSREEAEVVDDRRLALCSGSLNQPYICAKFLVSVLCVGLSVLLLFSSWKFCPSGEQATIHPNNGIPSPASSTMGKTAIEVITQVTQKEKCDLFDGEWIPHASGPTYTNESCLLMDGYWNCMLNGRLDKDYLSWRWKPKGCDLPLFDAERFLKGMKNKSWAFVGDSIVRNHFQSLLCLLSQVEKPTVVFRDKQWRSWTWHFSSSNFSLSLVWSPVLVKADNFEEINQDSSAVIQLHVDVLHEEWTSQLNKFDYVVISGGKWFLRKTIFYENNKIVGCYYCPGKNITELGYDYGTRKVLNLALGFIASSDFKGTVLFRTFAPDHYDSGRSCKWTHPFNDGEVTLDEVDKVMRKVEMEAFERAIMQAQISGVDLRLLDTTYLSLLRPDGHPGPYRTYQPFAKEEKANVENDCLHWCLPGPIDYWNDLLMAMSLDHALWR